MSAPQRVPNARAELALHRLAEGLGTPLLLIHPLASSADYWRTRRPRWPGPIWAVDLSGHGASPPVRGRSYSAEGLAADADAALAHLGPSIVVGAGLGAYLALLLAGARADQVPVALLLEGDGLAGAGPEPRHPVTCPDPPAPLPSGARYDPEVEHLRDEARPPWYARELADSAARLVLVGRPSVPVPWWEAAAASPKAKRAEHGLQPVLDALAESFER